MTVYGGGGNSDRDGNVRGGGVSCDLWAKRTDPALNSASNLYSDSNVFLCMC